MAPDPEVPGEGSTPKGSSRRSFSIFRKVGLRLNPSRYDDVPSESSGDDSKSLTNAGGKKLRRPEPLVRSSSDRTHEDGMGAGQDARSSDKPGPSKPLPAQSQGSPVLNLFRRQDYERPSSSSNAAHEIPAALRPGPSLYDPERAAVSIPNPYVDRWTDVLSAYAPCS